MKNSVNKYQSPVNQVSFKKIANRMNVPQKQPPSGTGNEIWFVTLSDLLMLLMICFVLLFGMTLQQQSTHKANVTVPVEQPKLIEPIAVTPLQQQSQATSSVRDQENQTATLESDLLDIINDNNGLQGITVERHTQYVILTFPEQIIFSSGQAQLKSAVQPVLEKVALFIQNHPALNVEIQGHTDDRPIHNQRYPSNWELSADRATQVAKSLVQLGINPEKLSTKGFGEYRPLYSNDNDTNRLKNRRVELKFSQL